MIPVARNSVWETEPFLIYEQLYLKSGSLATSTTVSAASLAVYDLAAPSNPLTALYSTSLVVSTTVIPAATTGWTRDSTGYNVVASVGTAAFTRNGGRTYRVEMSLATTTDGTRDIVQHFTVNGLTSA